MARLQGVAYEVDLVGQPSTVPGVVGDGLHFNGIGQYVDCGHHHNECMTLPDLCPEGFTWALWLWLPIYNDDVNYILSAGRGQFYQIGSSIRWEKNGKLYVRVRDLSRYATIRIDTFPKNIWFHVAFTWNVEQVNVFINGILIKTSFKAGSTGYIDTSERLFIGRSYTGGPSANASSDEVLFWGKEKDASFIEKLYKVSMI